MHSVCEWLVKPAFGYQRSINVCLLNVCVKYVVCKEKLEDFVLACFVTTQETETKRGARIKTI